MSAAKHTPGPWQVHHGNPLQVCDADGERRGCAPIANAWTPTSQITGEAVANARLVAAAPELLAALKEAIDAVKVFHGPNCWEIYEANAPEMRRWRAAIAKATGSQA